MRVDVVTLFPEIFAGFLATSFVAHAIEIGQLDFRTANLREHGLGKHRAVDDTPYGGGSGMVLRVDVLVACLEALEEPAGSEAPRAHRVLLTPQGAPLDQTRVRSLAARPRVALVCGRYEGFDERVRSYVDEEISLGDFVMTGGEVAAMAIVDACVRLLPGVLGNEASVCEESHSPETRGLLEYPHYTRPASYRDAEVPAVLKGGNHAAIEAFRREEAERRTALRRPDLYARYDSTRPAPTKRRSS